MVTASRDWQFPTASPNLAFTIGVLPSRAASSKMQKVIRRTALARNQAQRKAILNAKAAKREDFKNALRERFAFNRAEIDRIRDERQRRQDDWMRGPLAPQRDAGLEGKSFGALSPESINLPKVPEHLRRKYINIAAGDRVVVTKGRDKGKISEVARVDPESESVTVKDLNVVRFPRGPSHVLLSRCGALTVGVHRPMWLFPTG